MAVTVVGAKRAYFVSLSANGRMALLRLLRSSRSPAIRTIPKSSHSLTFSRSWNDHLINFACVIWTLYRQSEGVGSTQPAIQKILFLHCHQREVFLAVGSCICSKLLLVKLLGESAADMKGRKGRFFSL